MRKNSLVLLLAAAGAFAQDDPAREDLVRRDRERIAARPPLREKPLAGSELESWGCPRPAAKLVLTVIPVGFSDDAGEDRPAVLDKLVEYARKQSGGRLELSLDVKSPVRLSQVRAIVGKERIGSDEEAAWVSRLLEKAGAGRAQAVCIAHAGNLEPGKNSMLWPHQASIELGGAAIQYYLAPQNGESAAAIHGHEFMHLFGLKDKYDTQNPHCILAYGYKPLALCASCRAAVGWATVARVKPQDSPVVRLRDFEATGECLRIDLGGDAEFLILELRKRELVVWHTLGGSTTLAATLDGKTHDRLTPYSEPRFRARSPGSRPLFVTDLRVGNEDATLKVSWSEPLTELEQDNLSRVGRVINPK